MRNLLRPRLASLDVYASALLAALGVVPLAACGGVANEEPSGGSGGSGGSSGEGGSTSSSATTGSGGSGASGTTGSTGPGTTSSTSASSSTGAGGGSGDCIDPKPLLVDGIDTGFDVCAGGQYRRRAAIECPTSYPDDNPCCGGCPDGQLCSEAGEVACQCVDACTTDAECGPGQLCLCGDPAGTCVQAGCNTAANCDTGEECTSWDLTLGCLYYQFACTTPADSCSGDLDCVAPNSMCAVQPDGHRECVAGGCAIGRPFLVDDEVRLAPLAERADWCAARPSPSVDGLDTALRDELASAWERTGAMEHASIAAFARFSLQLLSLGAPADLIERTHAAMSDETKHARAAFALASAYRGRQIGPGGLAIEGALASGSDVAAIVRLLVREGCVGETVAAVEAAEAAAHAADPAVREVLREIAADESSHAELAWRTARWALTAFGAEVRPAIAGEIALLEAELRASPVDRPGASRGRELELLEHGVVGAGLRHGMRRAVLERAVLPCLQALVSGAEAPRRGRGEVDIGTAA